MLKQALLVGVCCFLLPTQTTAKDTLLPENGVIPDEVTAVRVADAIFLPIFGEVAVRKFDPYKAHLKDGVWTVYGTLPPSSRGGTPQLRIQQRDGRVLEVWHSQ